MKKIVYAITLLAAVVLGACTLTPDDNAGNDAGTDAFRLVTKIDGLETGVTRSVAATEEEKKVHSLTLLFFEASADGTGRYIDYHVLTDVIHGVGKEVIFGSGSKLTRSGAYNILAVANLDQNRYVKLGDEGMTVDGWCNAFAGKTENEVIAEALANITGDSDGSRCDEVRIYPDKILMNAMAAKAADQTLVEMTLTRNVCRLDVVNRDAGYHLRSATIFNAAKYSRVWSDEVANGTVERFYGVEAEPDGAGYKDIRNELYCFENFMYKPSATDKPESGNTSSTTCLVIGMQKHGETDITYHRVNIAPKDGLPQSLKRNMVYQVTVRGVYGAGESTEVNARNNGENNLNYIINYWDLDEGDGIIKFDGKNVLAVPTSKIQFTSAAETREYNIFTFGEGVLVLAGNRTDPGITATLTGNTLRVEATALPEGTERTGELKFTFAGMEADVAIVQNENFDHYLELSTYSLPTFPNVANKGVTDGAVVVSASGKWEAELRNNVLDQNLGTYKFSFLQDSYSGRITSDDVAGNTFPVYTASANADAYSREAFVVVRLVDDNTIAKAVLLTQKGMSDMTFYPQADKIVFAPDGTASTQNIFTVNPDMLDGKYLEWRAVMEYDDPADAGQFVANYTWDPVRSGDNKFIVVATKSNLTGRKITARVKVSLVDNPSVGFTIPVEQSFYSLSIYPETSQYKVPKTGGESESVDVMIPESLTWSATIVNRTVEGVSLVAGHQGYLVDERGNHVTELTDMSPTQKLKVYFPKLLTPNINATPEIVVRVQLTNAPLYKEITFRQEALVGRPVVIQSSTSTGYGSLGTQSASETKPNLGSHSSYVQEFSDYLASAKICNSQTASSNLEAYINGATRRAANYSTTPGSGVTGFMVTTKSLTDTEFAYLENWRKADDGNFVLLAVDIDDWDKTFERYLSKFHGYTGANSGSRDASKISTAWNIPVSNKQKLFDYLMRHGPATAFIKPGYLPYSTMQFTNADGVNKKISSYPDTTMPLLVKANGDVMITIDLEKRIMIIGETSYLSGSEYDDISKTLLPVLNDKSMFLANLTALINLVQAYGSHFTDHFTGKATGGYAVMTLNQVTPNMVTVPK